MRIATNEELLLINGSSQKLSKNQLKKLYDHGGVLTPKDWATMIDNVAQNEVPVIYTADDLYYLSKNKKLIPGHIYYTEYYGEFRSEHIHTNLSKPDIIYLKAISDSKFSKGYDFRGRKFNIEFCNFDVDLYGDITKPIISKCTLNTNIKSTDYNQEEYTSIKNRDVTVIMIPKVGLDEEVYYKASILTELSEPILDNYVVDITNGFLYLKGRSQLGGDADISYTNNSNGTKTYSISREESVNAIDSYGISYEIQLSCEFSTYDEPEYIIQLLDIIDENNNYFKDVDYGTSCSLLEYYNPEFEFLPFYNKCITDSSYNNIKGDNSLWLNKSNNNIIDNSEFWGDLCDNNTIINSIVGGIQSDGYNQSEPNMYMSNCTFNNCRAYLLYSDVLDQPSININKTSNINNIHFTMSSNSPFSFYNCVRPNNSPKITINSIKTITIGDPEGETFNWDIADYENN